MNARTILYCTAALAPILLATHSEPTRIRFGPADGSSVTKTFANKATLTLDRFTLSGLGGTQSPDMEGTRTTSQKLVVSDEYVKTKDGSPRILARTFDELGAEMASTMKQSMMGQSQTSEQNMRAKSELEGKKVVFTWDADKNEYKKAFDPTTGKDDLLRGLQEDLDLRGFLPKDDVKEGDSWEFEPRHLMPVFMPGGDLSLVPENVDEKSMKLGGDMGSMLATIGNSLEGTAKAKLVSVKDIDGVPCAAIRVQVKVHSKADMLEATRKALASGDLPPEVKGIEFEKNDVKFTFEGEGELVWDLKAGHFRSLELSGQSTVQTEQTMSIEAGGKTMKLEQSQEMSGQATYSAKAK